MQKLICQEWLESERGWGTRPDGCSLHLTDVDRLAFIKKYWDGMPETPPDEYSRPSGLPYAVEVDETKISFESMVEKHGVRLHQLDFTDRRRTNAIRRI